MSSSPSPTKILFPPPPPTTNSLTTQQRTQLVRKAKKLEQILGAAPHLLDISSSDTSSPVHVSLPKLDKRPPSYTSTIRSSTESFSSSSSSTSHLTASSVSSKRGSLGRSSSTLRKARPLPREDSSSPRSPSYETWSSTKPPFLRLSLAHSGSPGALSLPPHIAAALPSTDKSGQHSRYTMAPPVPRTAKSALPPTPIPTFNVASMGSTRKSKMDRLRKKLGQGVPIELVFPKDIDGDDTDDSPTSPTSEQISAFVFPAPHVPRTKSKKSGTIAGARDSLTEDSIHHAPRAPPSSKLATLRSSRQEVSLGAIIESPEEHGMGCAEEFGLVRSNGEGRKVAEIDEAEIKLWSTREGYEGWEPVCLSKGRRSWGYRKTLQSVEI
ncbi:hypothetical protein FA15DRAFT_674828 [Coprinopsis marcescibilis]|uniref:Uncharacterized protein n=1 Tax=Coprinopsis marcescibilis TaxID=230819 RepID=A0A5C3KGR4_COPMA|nr:hypothetical protein FA15DRAFT_674828 [Coprinopsis marcescibilis]